MKIRCLFSMLVFLGLSACAFIDPYDADISYSNASAQIAVYILNPVKNSIGVEVRDIVQASMKLVDPVSNVQTKIWDSNGSSVFYFSTTRSGQHTFIVTDVDNLSNTNVTSKIFTLKTGYNYRVNVMLGGSIEIDETTATAEYDPGTGWLMVWNDEFDGSALNTAVWSYDIGTGPNSDGWGNNELEYYTSRTNNIRVQNGILTIQAWNESYGGRSYTSARIKTKDIKSWKYGKIVARIKMPYGKGMWPAFWMLGSTYNNTNWPSCGEMDIAEMVGGGTSGDNTVYGTLFWTNSGTAYYQKSTNTGQALSGDYHVYEMEWNSAWVKIRIDQKEYFFYDISSPLYDLFRLNFYIILNLAVGGNWPGSPDGSTVFPQTMQVDWVRVYQKDPLMPILNISYPQDNTTLYGQFPLRGNAEGSNTVNRIYLSVDNAAFVQITNTGSISYGLNLTAGSHNLRIYAQDVSNKNSLTNDMNVTVTWTKPVVTFTYMPPEGSSDQVRGLLTGVSPSMYKVSLQIFTYWLGWWVKPTYSTPFTSVQADGTWSAIYVSGGVDSMARAMKVYVIPSYVDTVSNVISNAVTAVFSNRVDNHANTAYVVDPNTEPPYSQKFNDFTNNSTVYTTNGTIAFTGWAVDSTPDGAAGYVRVSIDGGPYTNTNYIGSYYQEWNLSRTFTAGAHSLSVYKKDNGFGIGETNTMNFTVVIDAVKPTVSPVSSNFTGTSVTVTGTASDNAKLKKVVVNWYLWHDFGSGPTWNSYGSYDATGTTSWSSTFNSGYTGTNMMEIYSVDMAGNESARVTNRIYTY